MVARLGRAEGRRDHAETLWASETLGEGGTGYCTVAWVDGALKVSLQDVHPGYEYEAFWTVPEADLGPVAARMGLTVDDLRLLTTVEVGPEIAS